MGLCTSKGTVIISPDRRDTFTNPTPVTYKRRVSGGTNETKKEEPAVNIQTESNNQTGTARDDANSTVVEYIDQATNENNERHEERNSNERKPDTGRKTDITSLSKIDEPMSQGALDNGLGSEKLNNEVGRHSEQNNIVKENPDDKERNNVSLTFKVDKQNDVHKRDEYFPPADTNTNTIVEAEEEESDESSDSETLPNRNKKEGQRNLEEHKSTKDNVNEDHRDRPGSKQKREPDKKSKKKFNFIGNTIKFIQRPDIVQALVGNMDVNVPNLSRIVRIFISSTFTDTKNERDILMKKAYPELKTVCQKLGYEFQVVDMRWGVHDTATDSQTGTELCLNEIKLCQKLSTGPSFVSLVSHKYGYRMLPRTIESTIFEKIMSEIKEKENNDAIKYFEKWYRKDDNAVPSEFVVAAITLHFPGYFSSDTDKKSQSRSAYNKEYEIMMSALEESVAGIEYSKSVTEVETRCGLFEVNDSSKNCVWFQRIIKEIEVKKPSDILSRYIESGGEESKWKRPRELLAKMKNKMTSTLGEDMIWKDTVDWDDTEGINPKKAEHDRYLQKLAADFVTVLSSMIENAAKKCVPSDTVLEEVHRHIQFCKKKCKTFYGRDDCLRKMEKYITGQSQKAMVVYGVSGCGKTSLMAKGAHLARDWTSEKAAVILRFIGTSQRSTTIKSLLQDLTHQIKRIYRTEVTVSQNFKDIQQDFKESLKLANDEMPLILILDSLDQLDPANNARQLKWLPNKLPDYCKVILSTLPDKSYQCYPILKKSIKNKDNFLEVTPIPNGEVMTVIENWLQARKRTLTAKQMDCVSKAYEKCSLPLFLKLSFEEAIRWNSFSNEKETILEDTVKGSINALFKKLEDKHRRMLVSRALGYLTVSQNGITEAELEDVLSCDDDVLTDIYKFWTPPIRRLPPLLLVRLKTDLEHYLVERDADGSRVFYWYHRQFKETAEERYCSKKEERDLLHTGLADFFSGLWANDNPKPFPPITRNDKGKEEEEQVSGVRFVSAQPLNENNLRKLNNLPFHRLKAGKMGKLKKECLCNFMFLLTKLRATNLWSVMDDFALAKSEFPKDETIKFIHGALQISQDSLLYDPDQLPVQMILRLENTLTTDDNDFLSQCRNSGIPYLLPDKNVLLTPGGQLVHSMAGHMENSCIYSVDVSKDGQYTVTCGDDETVRLWLNGDEKRDCRHTTESVRKAYFCLDDAFLLIYEEDKIVVKNISGLETFNISVDATSWCLCGPRRQSLVLFKDNYATMYNLETGEKMNPVKCKKTISFSCDSTQSYKDSSFLGSEHYAVAFSIQKTTICLLDISQQQFVLYHNVCHDSSIQKDDVEIMQWVITNNETCIAYTCSSFGSIYFVDIRTKQRLRELQVFKEEHIGEILDLQISRDKHYLTFILAGLNDKSTLVVNSLEEQDLFKRESLKTSFTYASSSNGTTVVTSSESALVQVWDLTQPQEGPNSSEVYKSLQCMPNSRYVLGTYSEGRVDTNWTMFVYDVCEGKTVRHAKLPTDVDVLLTGYNTVIVWPLIEDSKTAFLVDLTTMSMVTELKGLPLMKQCHVYGNYKELVSWTEEGHVNFYSLQTGEQSFTMDVGTISQLHVNRQGSVMTVNGQDMVDVYLGKKFLHSIKYQDCGVMNFNGIPLFTDDGNYIIFRVHRKPPKCHNGPEIQYLVVWDIKKGLLQHIEDPGRSINLQTLDGSNVFLSYGYEEDAFSIWDKQKIWDRQTLKPVASFKPDNTIDKVMITMDGRYIIGIDKNQGIIRWELVIGPGKDNDKPGSFPEDFPYQDTVVCLDLGIEVKKEEEKTIVEDKKNDKEEQGDDSDQVKRDTDDDEGKEEEDFYSSDDDFEQAKMDTNDNEKNDLDRLNMTHEDIERFQEGRESDTDKDEATRNDKNSEHEQAIDNIWQSTEIRNGKHNINNGKDVDEEGHHSDASSEDW
ncbi:hypothetical protein ACJMK2_038846 [Sinanodonta woodiana]|uniref:Uncharacterized protein n=1 Tax=Sinanodonta woodiana TaxID=1069815 RepID=A0ABD3WBM5_SINWO